MKNSILYVNGCSYAYGQGVHEEESICIEERFSRTLSGHFELKEVNNSLPGSCNQRIARRSLIDLVQYKPKLAIIVWSDPARTEFKYADTRRTKYPFELDQAKASSLKYSPREVGIYYDRLRSVEQDVLNTLHNMLSVKIASDSMSMPCIQLHFREHFSRDLKIISRNNNKHYQQTISEYLRILGSDELVYGIPGREMHSFETLGGNHLDKTGHPNKNSHENVSKWIINLIEEKSLL